MVVINKETIKNVKSTREEKITTKKCRVLKKRGWKKARRNLYERVKGAQAEEHSTFIRYVQCLTTKHTLTIQVMTTKVETSKKNYRFNSNCYKIISKLC